MRVFFATDIHGSEVCWRKFLNSAAFYKADLVVLGGDVTGKVMVPIVVSTSGPGSAILIVQVVVSFGAFR